MNKLYIKCVINKISIEVCREYASGERRSGGKGTCMCVMASTGVYEV